MNLKWFELSGGHDLERMLQFTNQRSNGKDESVTDCISRL